MVMVLCFLEVQNSVLTNLDFCADLTTIRAEYTEGALYIGKTPHDHSTVVWS